MAAGHDLGIAIHPETTTRAGLVPILIVSPGGSVFRTKRQIRGYLHYYWPLSRFLTLAQLPVESGAPAGR
jgi:hypothetical protein